MITFTVGLGSYRMSCERVGNVEVRSLCTRASVSACSSSSASSHLQFASPHHRAREGGTPLISSDQTVSMTKAKLPFPDKEACERKIHRPDCLINRGGCYRPYRDASAYPRQGPTTGTYDSNRLSGSIVVHPSQHRHRLIEVNDPVARRMVLRAEPREKRTHTRDREK